jgi:hypothetical protein
MDMSWEDRVKAVKTALGALERQYGVQLAGWDDGSVTIWEHTWDSPQGEETGDADHWISDGPLR